MSFPPFLEVFRNVKVFTSWLHVLVVDGVAITV